MLASYLERGPLIWMMPLHLNKKSDYDENGTKKTCRVIKDYKFIILQFNCLNTPKSGLSDYSQNVPKSKRPLVKTSPKIGQNIPMLKIVGQNVPKMIFYSIFYLEFRHNLGCLNKTGFDKVFLSRFHSVISVK